MLVGVDGSFGGSRIRCRQRRKVTVWDEDAVRHLRQLKEAAQKEVHKIEIEIEKEKEKEIDPPNVTSGPWTLTLLVGAHCWKCSGVQAVRCAGIALPYESSGVSACQQFVPL